MNQPKESVQHIPLENLIPFQDHPFRVRSDLQMELPVESIQSVGVLVPAIVRPLEGGSYELISGHRRKYACEQLGTLPRRSS